jgi:glycosyltransferase involved in cell wall biosynthesis
MGQQELLASVVVPVRGEADEILGLLSALSAQTLESNRFEVLIADDGSPDRSIAALAGTDARVRITTGPPRNSYAARNRGASLAKAPVIAFCDADCLPEPSWLENGLAALGSADVAAGLVQFVIPSQRSIWTLLDVDTFLDQERAVKNGTAATANLFVRRELFERVGGFDDSVPNTSDYDFVARCVSAGATLNFEPGAVVRHPTRDSARSFIRKTWAVNRRYAERERRAGRRPNALKLREWVPVIQPLRSRRRFGRSLRLDRRRLSAHGVRPTVLEEARALPLIYLGLPYISHTAQLVGWWSGHPLDEDRDE